jgi:nucleotidyltransferase substrate binding protein (TIGR01987 family)
LQAVTVRPRAALEPPVTLSIGNPSVLTAALACRTIQARRKRIPLNLDYSHLRKSIARLAANLALARDAEAEGGPLFAALRDGTIQSFEFAYTMSIRALDRTIADRVGAQELETAAFRDRLRMAWEAGLLPSVDIWLDFRHLRNETSHTYDEAKATKVYAAIPSFLDAAREVLETLESKRAH